MSDTHKERIRRRGREIGFDAVGFAPARASAQGEQLDFWLRDGRHGDMRWMERNAERRRSVLTVMPEARTLIVVALNYFVPGQGSRDTGHGLVARYARGRDYHRVMEKMLKQLCQAIGEECGPAALCRAYVDTGPVLEREQASRAGLGWQGKSTMLISRQRGTWFLIGEILTSAALEPDAPSTDHCGSCSRCMEACPTGAITAPYHLDARRCIAYLTIEHQGAIPEEFREAVGDRIFGCDDCLTACPWNRFAHEAGVFKKYAREDLARLDPVEILRMDESGFAQRFAGTPLKRLGLRRLQRNAAVVLGNSAAPGEASLQALEQAAASGEALVGEHALWALRQIRAKAGKKRPEMSAAAFLAIGLI